MANAFQFKRGTTTRRLTYTPLSGELVYDTTLNKMFIGDGITAGGIPLKTEADKLYTPRTIGGVAFDGTVNINLPGVNTTGNQSTSGNAATATKLATPRAINGIPFDGSADITLDQNNGVFLGSVQWYNGNRNSVPDGYVTLDGQLLDRPAFPELWAAISGGAYPLVTEAVWLDNDSKRASYSSGNGTTTFRLPDLNGAQSDSLKGLFPRGDGNGTIAGVTVASGQTQSDAIRNISGETSSLGLTQAQGNMGAGALRQRASVELGRGAPMGKTAMAEVFLDASLQVPTANENRPVSAIGVWIVRATGATSPLPASGSPATLLANTFNGSQKIVGNLEVTGNLDISGTLAFAKGFENSLNETGWQKLPGGLILQWGTVSLVVSTGGSLTQPVIYPITFPNNVLHIFMGYRESTGGSADSSYSRDRTNTGFNIGQTAGEAHTCSWLAIGR